MRAITEHLKSLHALEDGHKYFHVTFCPPNEIAISLPQNVFHFTVPTPHLSSINKLFIWWLVHFFVKQH